MALTNKDLEAIEQIFDKKLQFSLQPVINRLDGVDLRLDKVEVRLNEIDLKFDKVEARLDGLESKQETMDNRLRRIELLHENDILPRLQTIESCYLDTYKAYAGKSETICKMQTDIDALNSVVAEHSRKLEKIS